MRTKGMRSICHVGGLSFAYADVKELAIEGSVGERPSREGFGDFGNGIVVFVLRLY
jgi:hypothetical protein